MERKQNQESKKPLLYIQQPDFHEPNMHMQNQFITSSKQPVHIPALSELKEKSKTENYSQANKSRGYADDEIIRESSEIEVGENITTVVDNSQHINTNRGLIPLKSFPSMTTEEKIQYLLTTTPFYFCDFIIQNEKVTGKLRGQREQEIMVETYTGDLCTIQKKDLQGIRILA